MLFHIKIKLLTGKEFLDIFVPGFFYAFIHGKCIHGNGLFKENSNLLNNYEEMFDYVVYKKFDENRSTNISDLIENEEKEQ